MSRAAKSPTVIVLESPVSSNNGREQAKKRVNSPKLADVKEEKVKNPKPRSPSPKKKSPAAEQIKSMEIEDIEIGKKEVNKSMANSSSLAMLKKDERPTTAVAQKPKQKSDLGIVVSPFS